MGQKVNPISNRLGVIRGWDSSWYGQYSDRLVEDTKIREYLNARLAKASVSRIVIERTLKLVTITVCTARPGLIIGKGGQEVEVVILEINAEQQRISLGLKQVESDPWSNIDELYKVGDVVKGKVTKIAQFGAFVELSNKIDGLIHISQLSRERVEKVKDVLKIGDEVEARVIKVDNAERRIGLSIKAVTDNFNEEQLKAAEAEFTAAFTPGKDIVDVGEVFTNEAMDNLKLD
jgi:predicted RNA-binding protein with RPS1 domain